MRKNAKLWLTRISQLFGCKSKKERVLDWLQEGNTISPREAIKYFNSYRLSDIIFRLKKEGYYIVNNNKKGLHAEYQLIGAERVA